MEFEVKAFSGKQAENYIEAIADLRIRLFRDYPYLYEGSSEYEKEYLGRYFKAPGSKVFLLFYGERIIGATTCIPLAEEADFIQKPFLENGLNLTEYFYFGESLLERIYRGKGFGKLFFQYREDEALKHPQIRYSCFCALNRPDDHQLKPDQYRPLNGFWKKLGYVQQPQMQAAMSWKDIDQPEETTKKLPFWIKKLR